MAAAVNLTPTKVRYNVDDDLVFGQTSHSRPVISSIKSTLSDRNFSFIAPKIGKDSCIHRSLEQALVAQYRKGSFSKILSSHFQLTSQVHCRRGAGTRIRESLETHDDEEPWRPQFRAEREVQACYQCALFLFSIYIPLGHCGPFCENYLVSPPLSGPANEVHAATVHSQ